MTRANGGLRMLACVAMVCATASCGAPTATDNLTLRGNIALSRQLSGGASLVAPPFVSVVDSLALSIIAGGSTQLIGRKLGATETNVTIPVTLAAGVATIAVQVLSNNRAVLFSGTATPTIDADGFSIDVPLVAINPVLVALPDTAKSISIDSTSLNQQRTKIVIHNSGTSTLSWSVKTVDSTFSGFNCFDFAGNGVCTVVPIKGSVRLVPANGNDTLTITIPYKVGGGNTALSRFPARTFVFVLGSAQGDVTVRWKYPFP